MFFIFPVVSKRREPGARRLRPKGTAHSTRKEAGQALRRNPSAAAAAQAGLVSPLDAGSLLSAPRCGFESERRCSFTVWVPGATYPDPADMSGFSPELIDYLEGKISFEEFERRREERKTREKKVRRC